MASMYVGGRAVSSFGNCSTNVLIKVMGIKDLSSATFWLSSMLNDVRYGYSQTMIAKFEILQNTQKNKIINIKMLTILVKS